MTHTQEHETQENDGRPFRAPYVSGQIEGLGGIRAQPGPLVGREELIERGLNLLGQRSWLSLTGQGGVGKTRLALELAQRAARASLFADGVVLVGLASLAAAGPDDSVERVRSHVLSEVLKALGLPDNTDARGAECKLREWLIDREVLLVLDNCEHVATGVRALVPELLTYRSKLRVLTTSRDRLEHGERVLRVPPLPYRGAQGQEAPPAVSLLVDLAANRDLVLDPQDPDVLELSRLLGGLPLAIVLAVANLEGRGIRPLIKRLHEDPLALRDTLVHSAPQHRSLRAVMDWSLKRLTDDERAMWSIAAEFRGHFTIEDAEKLGARLGFDQDTVAVLVGRLLHRSLLESQPGSDRTRLLMPYTVRAYGLGLEPEGITRDRIKAAHAGLYAHQAAQAAASWYGPDERRILRELQESRADARAALTHYLSDAETVHEGLRLAINRSKVRVGIFGGQLRQDRQEVGDALAAIARHRPGEHTALEVEAHALGAFLELCLGQRAEGVRQLGRAHDLHAVVGGEVPPWLTLADGFAQWLSPDAAHARTAAEALDEAVLAAREHGSPGDHVLARMFSVLAAGFDRSRGAVEQAQVYLAQTEEAGSEWAACWAGIALAIAEHQDGRPGRAAKVLRPVLAVLHDMNEMWGRVWAAWITACAAAESGHVADAVRLFGAVSTMLRSIGVDLDGLPPWVRTQQAAKVRCLAELGTQGLHQLRAEGEHLDIDQAVNLALRLLEKIEDDAEADTDADLATTEKLTRRELEVTLLIIDGLTDAQIAERLFLSIRTVENHGAKARAKLGAPNRTALAARYAEMIEKGEL
ncbi:ATP-binding protein [Actinokineospora iranica]|uniref:ATP-binding protein n=1 Tax=Actinokineospora iranica TaxID=1271860 RepID=UPI001587739D|nr:LuxR C-terminal-related transcriptional regulator [Actinokineospora iranica]